ncbi:zinc finger protein 24-like [Dermochelys coriacea]|uniref:zinc finger protein 24-like n=1 Tax=Dermochelys coriacea TaxID=27794 RepID=UPI0018E7E83B|nr:zinc finger protein 24-like [Dermochelys coriacea]
MAAELGASAALGFQLQAPLQHWVQPPLKMEEQDPVSPKPGERVEGAEKTLCVIQAGTIGGLLRWAAPQWVKQKPQEEPATLCRDDTHIETRHWRFRQFHYQEAKGPQEAYSHLQELCHGWLEPQSHTKEQILELLILEQFLTILPEEMQRCVWEHGPETYAQAVAQAEGYQLRQPEVEGPGLQPMARLVTTKWKCVTRENNQTRAERMDSIALGNTTRQNKLISIPRVGRASVSALPLLHPKESTRARNAGSVMSVEKDLATARLSQNTGGCMPARNPLSALPVVGASARAQSS